MDSCFICVLISRLSPPPPVPITRAQLMVPSSFPPGMAVGVQTLVLRGERKALLWGGRVAGVEEKNKNPQKIHF